MKSDMLSFQHIYCLFDLSFVTTISVNGQFSSTVCLNMYAS